MTPYQREIRDFLREYGATGVVLVSGSKHPKLAYTWRGKAMEYVVSGSSSDGRAAANAVADLKRRHPDGPIASTVRMKRKLDEMVEAIPFNPIPLPDMVEAQRRADAGVPMPVAPDLPSPPSPVASTEIPADWVQPTYNPRVTLAPINREFLKWLIDDINRVVDETDWRLARHPKTGRWRLFTVVE